jgi:Putative adhesin
MTARTAGIALVVTLGAATLYAADTRNIDRTLPLGASGTITLDTHNGAIAVRTWDRPDVEIHVQIAQRGSSAAAHQRFTDTTVDIDGAPNLVSIRSKELDNWGWLVAWTAWDYQDNSPEIRFTITAPRTARWRIRTHNGKADIRDVAAALEFDTHNGSVWIANLSGPLDLHMHNGDAHVDFASFTQASRISSHNGTAEVTLPASSKFRVESIGHRMQMQSDFPVTMRSSDFGRHHVEGQVNGGGPELHLASHNGSFRLRSK